MLKKIFNTVSLLIISISILVLAACEKHSLNQYKEEAKNEIDQFVSTKEQIDYTTIGWNMILEIVIDGKENINIAIKESEVDLVVDKTKNRINLVEEAELFSIHYYTIRSFSGNEKHQLYDFNENFYSTKSIIFYSDDYGEREEIEECRIKDIFTKEKVNIFFKHAKEQGLLSLEKYYSPSEIVYDGSAWRLEINFKDGDSIKSAGYHVFPEQAEELNKYFIELSGYRLFTF